jgi:hypothetical protein
MAVINHIALSQLGDELRFDSQYYTPSNMLLEKEICAFPTRLLGSIAHVTDGQHGYFKLDEQSEIRQITAKCIKSGLVDKAQADHLSAITHNSNLRSSLSPNDVLVTTAGTIGEIGLVTDDIPPANIDQDIGRIAIHDSTVSPLFVWAFLQTKFGRFQIDRFTTGQVQTHLSLNKMKKMRLPLLSNHAGVENSVSKYVSSMRASNDLYQSAKQCLESELGLDKLNFQRPVGYTARFSELESSGRMDPEQFFPAFKAFRAGLPSRIALSPLGQYLSFCKRGKQPIYAKVGLPVVNSKHVQPNGVIQEDNRVALPNPNDDFQIRAGDTLLNGTGRGTLGRAAPYLSDEPAVPDNHVMLLRSSRFDPVFLSLYLNSAAGQMQVEMHQRGSSGQIELYPFDVRKFLVWPASAEFQKELRDLYDQATTADRESRLLLDQAKARVEQLIERAAQP